MEGGRELWEVPAKAQPQYRALFVPIPEHDAFVVLELVRKDDMAKSPQKYITRALSITSTSGMRYSMSPRNQSLTTLDDFLREIAEDRELAEQQRLMKPSMDLAMMMVDIRKALELSQRDFARKTGVSQAYIAQLESGTANPSIRKLNQLLRRAGIALNLSATIYFSRQFEQEAMTEVRNREDRMSEGEMYHVRTAMQGVVNAVTRSRIDEAPLDGEQVVGEILSAYEESQLPRRASNVHWSLAPSD